ncbi:TetR/AcrR family transcriptional regulator [Secundilactobacillus hailunensis]|uniref:TetR/AcrR family transcriptional regulator n=1 Tax=Secundilactobacillus hailunensis TaxID=2559923 RepID=A0ABW1T663_9LACO|nr:TetR/AcrR family transcriptional regulator [Secundilactobacillus hailunensis]
MTKENTFSKSQFITVSKTLFATQGYTGTTTREIIQGVGGAAKGLLYYYFPKGKREILGCILKRNGLERLGNLEVDFSQSSTPAELETALMTTFKQIEVIFQNQAIYQLFVITVRERLLLTAQEASLVTQAWQQLSENLGVALSNCPVSSNLKTETCDVLGQIIVSIFQKAINDALLISNKQQLSDQLYGQIQTEIHYLLSA